MITGITFWQTINGLFSSQFIILGQPSSPCVWWANIWELYGQGNRVSSTKYDYSPITARHWIHIYLLFNQTMKHYTLNILVSYIIHILYILYNTYTYIAGDDKTNTAAGIPRQWAELGLEPQLSTTWRASLDEDATSAMQFFTPAGVGGVVRWCTAGQPTA